jgi:hypothetical protein
MWRCAQCSHLMGEPAFAIGGMGQQHPFTSQEDSEETLHMPHKPNIMLTVMPSLISGPQVSSGVLFLTQSPARLASPPCCPLVSLSSEESPCNIRESVSHAFSPSSSHSHNHTQLLSKPSQATTSSPSLKQALRYQRDHFTHTHTHTYNPHHGLLHQQPVRLCLRCC